MRTIRWAVVGLVAVMITSAMLVAMPQKTWARDRVSFGGSIPHVMRVGGVYQASLWFRNNGKAVSRVVLDLSGMTDHSVVDRLRTNMGRGQKSPNGDYWRYGRWGRGAVLRVSITFSPKDAGNHNIDVALWDGWDSSTGIPTGTQLVGVDAEVAINPA